MYVAVTDDGFYGWVNYNDRADDFKFYGYDIADFYLSPDNTVRIFGHGTVNGKDTWWFHVMAIDNGEPGVGWDVFHIWIYEGPDATYRLFDHSVGTLAAAT